MIEIKIALVDDDLMLKKNGRPNSESNGIGLLGVWLEEHIGVPNVTCYKLGSELIKALQQNPYRFDLILIDFELKYNDGQFENAIPLGKAILEIAPYISLVILSNKDSFPNCRAITQAGFMDFIPKIDVTNNQPSFLKEIDNLFQLPAFKRHQAFKQLSFDKTWDKHLEKLNQNAKDNTDWYAYTLVRWLLVSKLLRKLPDFSPGAIKRRLPTMEKFCEDHCNQLHPSETPLKLKNLSDRGNISSKRGDTLEKWLPILIQEFALIPLNSEQASYIKINSKGSNAWAADLTKLKTDESFIQVATWLLSVAEPSILIHSAYETLKRQFNDYNVDKIKNEFQFLAEKIPNIRNIAALVKLETIPNPDNLK